MASLNSKHCQAKKKNGQPCRGFAIDGSKYCVVHDPDSKEVMKAGRRKGGASTMAKLKPKFLPTSDFAGKTVTDVVGLLTATINQARTGEIDLKVANAVGYLSNILLRALETSDIEERIEKLERTLEAKK